MVEITVEEAIKILKRCDNEHYTSKKRAAHRMAIDAIMKLYQIENQNKVNTDNVNECMDNS